VRTSSLGEITVHLFERDGQLCEHQKLATGGQFSESVTYKDVDYIKIETDSTAPEAGNRTLDIGDSSGNDLFVNKR